MSLILPLENVSCRWNMPLSSEAAFREKGSGLAEDTLQKLETMLRP